jgi:hypothetical protein
MKFEPRRGQAFGRIVVRTKSSTIVRPDATKGISKFVLVDAAHPDFEAAGYKVGDVLLADRIITMVVDDGALTRPIVEQDHILLAVRDFASLDEFHVQVENGTSYVPFSDPRAAVPLGASLSTATNGSPRSEHQARP